MIFRFDSVRNRRRLARPQTELNGTFTQAGRNVKSIQLARELMANRQYVQLRVLQIGPGVVLSLGRLIARDGRKPGKWARKFESAGRKLRLPNSAYRSFESEELYQALAGLAPVRLTIMDRSYRVLELVAGSLLRRSPALMRSPVQDRQQQLEGKFDLVMCCNVFAHIHDRDAWNQARSNILAYAAPDAVIICDDHAVLGESRFTHRELNVFCG